MGISRRGGQQGMAFQAGPTRRTSCACPGVVGEEEGLPRERGMVQEQVQVVCDGR